jgi:hypothetical protein
MIYFLDSYSYCVLTEPKNTGYETRRDWTSSVFFLFVELPTDWGAFTIKQLKGFLESAGISVPAAARSKENLVVLCDANLPRMRLEISGTAFAITPRRFITCHHCVYDETTTATLHTVAICSSILKQGDKIVPHPTSPLMFGDLHCFDVNLDFAIFNLRGPETHALLPIPVCPEDQLPGIETVGVLCVFYCAIGDFQVGELENLRVWRGGPYPILQYGDYPRLNDPPECRIFLEHGLCRGSSGGAIVVDGHVAAMHLASLNQGRHVWRHVRGSSLAHSVGESITDMEEIRSAYKEGLVLCRVPAIMDAINNP